MTGDFSHRFTDIKLTKKSNRGSGTFSDELQGNACASSWSILLKF